MPIYICIYIHMYTHIYIYIYIYIYLYFLTLLVFPPSIPSHYRWTAVSSALALSAAAESVARVDCQQKDHDFFLESAKVWREIDEAGRNKVSEGWLEGALEPESGN